MDELTFILILAGIGVVLLVAMFTYYKHHKKIKDEIENFNHHSNTIDDVLLNGHETTPDTVNTTDKLTDSELPGSFAASRQDNFDIDQVNISHEENSFVSTPDDINVNDLKIDKRELVDGVYINSKRVINTSNPVSESKVSTPFTKNTETFDIFDKQDDRHHDSEQLNSTDAKVNVSKTGSHSIADKPQNIKVIYDPVPDGVDELIISHTVLTKGDFFSGEQLFNVLTKAGLSYGEMNIFHYPGNDKTDTFALFSIANVIEPGTFDVQNKEMKTPGISIFMRLPTRIGSYVAYEKLIDVAKVIATELGGELCDETRSQLTQQTISYKKELIKKLNFEMAKAQKLADMRH
ncbi:MAG: hypothetical protein KZQ64_05395 [gamma proteobacterium symbiont of Bathyaustriella thionipta]|nr:hypothetical protein [gamma proteobacterium symbiont of Bathyaustriella thionipta]MCU7950717.1 hypothetical protein [gamma proteobacterium symbiont of Bathyaustriella thionipta]MCU7952813.1 hypothetical protein [gamma proteobacterium symbiont of Bathyaustriella thionipta]MCU7957135.1 hypothetical protein [gamma proteobacterium symbiont of Bathyaustriella thionipta]MCU7968800.1 hypothetical protein [gamma proteobacterium symbiont of Bathyaustriella thionipta]